MVLPMGTPELSGHRGERCLTHGITSLIRTHPEVTSAIEVFKALVIHLKNTFFHLGPLSAKQSHSFSLKSTSLKLLQVLLPQHQVLQF